MTIKVDLYLYKDEYEALKQYQKENAIPSIRTAAVKLLLQSLNLKQRTQRQVDKDLLKFAGAIDFDESKKLKHRKDNLL